MRNEWTLKWKLQPVRRCCSGSMPMRGPAIPRCGRSASRSPVLGRWWRSCAPTGTVEKRWKSNAQSACVRLCGVWFSLVLDGHDAREDGATALQYASVHGDASALRLVLQDGRRVQGDDLIVLHGQVMAGALEVGDLHEGRWRR